jgi:hypothetical protein
MINRKQVEQAIKKSALHHLQNANHALNRNFDAIRLGRDCCKLCAMIKFNPCVQCPVVLSTHEVGCTATPYTNVIATHRILETDNSAWYDFAMAELDEVKFLLSLLSKDILSLYPEES